jgi:hypothetical protein
MGLPPQALSHFFSAAKKSDQPACRTASPRSGRQENAAAPEKQAKNQLIFYKNLPAPLWPQPGRQGKETRTVGTGTQTSFLYLHSASILRMP